MSEWKEVRLGDFMEFNPKESLKKGTLAKKVTMDMLVPHSRDINSYVVEPYSGGAKFRNGDTIMARITPCLENGKHAFVSFLDDKEVAYGSTEYIVMRGKDGVSDNLFVYYLTHSPLFKATAIKSMVGSSGRQRAQVEVLQNLMISVPDTINEQIHLASILSSLDSKIENNRKICANLEAQAQALFKHWFIDFAPFKDGKFVESELGMIPEGWRVGTFGDVVEQITDKVKDRKDIKVLSPINSGELVLSDEYFTKQVYSKSIEKYILVKPLDFAYNPARVNIGSIGMNEFDFDGCVSPVYVVFRCIPEYHFYIDMVRKGAYFKRNVNKLAIGGVRQTLRYEDLSRIKLIIPPLSIIRDYNTFHYKIKESVKHLIQENLRLSTLRDTLLPKLMSGEIKV